LEFLENGLRKKEGPAFVVETVVAVVKTAVGIAVVVSVVAGAGAADRAE
jgi:hypothetical protein